MKVSEQKPYTVRENTWCFSFPPRCSKYKVVYRTVYKEQVGYLICACEILSNFMNKSDLDCVFCLLSRSGAELRKEKCGETIIGETTWITVGISCRNWRNKGPWKNVAKATHKLRTAIVAFQSVPRIAATVLVSRLTSANASRDTAARYVTSVSVASFFFIYFFFIYDGIRIPAIPDDSSIRVFLVSFYCMRFIYDTMTRHE